MSKIIYVDKKFDRTTQGVIGHCVKILKEYAAQGFVLTLRQLYYQFVARGLLPNTQKSYKRLGGIVGDARLAGFIDWEHIEDRSRNLALLQHFAGPQDALDKLAGWYHVSMWESQEWRPEVWIEKDALSGVIRGVCEENDVPYFCCRGYTSLSEMWRASTRLRKWSEGGQSPFIIHLGDHDPSGIDMSRDIYERLRQTFMADCEFERVALTMEQVEEYQPPPNPMKVRDPRAKTYVAKFGDESWELDALQPSKFRELIEHQLGRIRDQKLWDADLKEKAKVKGQLKTLASDWGFVEGNKKRLEEYAAEVAKLNRKVAVLSRKKKGKKPDA